VSVVKKFIVVDCWWLVARGWGLVKNKITGDTDLNGFSRLWGLVYNIQQLRGKVKR